MAARRNVPYICPGVKEELMSDPDEGSDWDEELDRPADRKAHVKDMAMKLTSLAGTGSVGAAESAGRAENPARVAENPAGPHVNKDGGAHGGQLQMKTPKYNGKADWEAFHAQFELLAQAAGWSEEGMALQLALCLTDEALTCLLLLSPAERNDYKALVGALKRRFGQCNQPGVLRSELASRMRRAGEPLRALANDIETLARRAYSHMPADVQSELARDQFIRAINPRELRVQTQLAHPSTLQEALELAVEREVVGAGAGQVTSSEASLDVRTATGESPGQERPAWATELTELIRAVTLQPPRSSSRPGRARDPPVCWVCGQTGHISVRCPKRAGVQGNGPGSA